MKEVNCSKVKDILRIRDYINHDLKEYGFTIPVKLSLFSGQYKLDDYHTASDVCNFIHQHTRDNAVIGCSRTGSYNFPEFLVYEL